MVGAACRAFAVVASAGDARWRALVAAPASGGADEPRRGKATPFVMSRLQEWASGVWIAEAPLRFFGVPFGARMTVIRLSNGGLLLHSPIAIDAELRQELTARGPVRHLVSPNKLHHLYLDAARRAFPEALLHAPPGLRAKRKDLVFDAELGEAAPEAWAVDLEQLIVRGSRVMEEVAFFHPSSRTLVVGDLCEHFGADSPFSTRVVARLARMYERPRMPPDWQWSFRDREATRASFERLFAWEFDRVILAHGRLLAEGAKARLEPEYAWALA